MPRRSIVVGACLLVLMGTASATDHKRKSLYTILEPSSCKVTKKHDHGNSYECAGLPGYPVYFAEGDHRTFLSFGRQPATRRAATQTLGAFNTPFEPGHRRTTIEWRFTGGPGRELPYATIVRYFISRDAARGQFLVVTRVGENEACHVAYIDAIANPDAIMIARRLADEVAPKFQCSSEPVVEGKRGPLQP